MVSSRRSRKRPRDAEDAVQDPKEDGKPTLQLPDDWVDSDGHQIPFCVGFFADPVSIRGEIQYVSPDLKAFTVAYNGQQLPSLSQAVVAMAKDWRVLVREDYPRSLDSMKKNPMRNLVVRCCGGRIMPLRRAIAGRHVTVGGSVLGGSSLLLPGLRPPPPSVPAKAPQISPPFPVYYRGYEKMSATVVSVSRSATGKIRFGLSLPEEEDLTEKGESDASSSLSSQTTGSLQTDGHEDTNGENDEEPKTSSSNGRSRSCGNSSISSHCRSESTSSANSSEDDSENSSEEEPPAVRRRRPPSLLSADAVVKVLKCRIVDKLDKRLRKLVNLDTRINGLDKLVVRVEDDVEGGDGDDEADADGFKEYTLEELKYGGAFDEYLDGVEERKTEKLRQAQARREAKEKKHPSIRSVTPPFGSYPLTMPLSKLNEVFARFNSNS